MSTLPAGSQRRIVPSSGPRGEAARLGVGVEAHAAHGTAVALPLQTLARLHVDDVDT